MTNDYLRTKHSLRLLLGALPILWAVIAQAADNERYVQEAEDYLRRGESRAAVIQLKNALQQNPNDTRARLLLGRTYLKLGQAKAAEQALKKARELGAAEGDVLSPLGEAYLLQGRYREVLDDVQVEEAAPPALRATVLTLHARARLALGQRSLAQANFIEALQLEPDNPEALLGLARLSLLERDYDGAEKNLARVLEIAPDKADAWVIKGELARQQGQVRAAKAAFTRAVALAPEHVAAHLGKATSHLTLEEYEQAEAHIAAVTSVLPEHPLANYLNAVVAYQQHEPLKAKEALQAVLRVAPNHPPSLLLLGTIHYGQGQLEQARRELERYVTAVPSHVPARKLLAATYLKLGQPKLAVETLEAVAAEASEDPQWLALLGSAYLRAGDAAKGTEWLEKAVAVAPDVAVLRTQLALGLLSRGATEQATTELETAVDLGQGLMQSNVWLVLTYLRAKEFDKALEAGQRLTEKQPDQPMPYNLLGGIHLAKGDVTQARRHFERALELSPAYSPAEMNLARLDIRAGELQRAKQHLDNILVHKGSHLGALLAQAQLAEAGGRRDEALQWLETAWEKNPGALQPGLLLAAYHAKQGEPMKAVGIARGLESAHPDDPRILRVLGAARLAMGEPASAVESYRKLVKRSPQSPEAWHLLANAQAMAQDLDGAVTSLEQALALKADYLPAEIALVRLKQRGGRTEEALRLARRVQKQHPDAPQGFELEGDIRASGQEQARAAEQYHEAFARQKTAPLAVKLFQARRRAGQAATSYEPLRQWLAEHPEDARVRLVLAQAYMEAGRREVAIEQYQQVLEAQPENVVVLNNLAWLLHEQEDPKAVGYAQRAHELVPDRPEIMDTLGWLLLEGGDSARGLELLQQAAGKAPHMPSIRYHRAVALYKNDRQGEARKELARLLRQHRDFTERQEAEALLDQLGG